MNKVDIVAPAATNTDDRPNHPHPRHQPGSSPQGSPMAARKLIHASVRKLVFGPRPEPLPLPSELHLADDGADDALPKSAGSRSSGSGQDTHRGEPNRAA